VTPRAITAPILAISFKILSLATGMMVIPVGVYLIVVKKGLQKKEECKNNKLLIDCDTILASKEETS
jgi:hypothetical protein